MSNERSAEWLRGRITGLQDISSYVRPSQHNTIVPLAAMLQITTENLAAAEAREAAPPPLLKRGKPRECTCLGSDSCTCSGPPAADQALPLAELQSRHAELAVDLFNAEARLEKAAEVIAAAEATLIAIVSRCVPLGEDSGDSGTVIIAESGLSAIARYKEAHHAK